MATIGFGRVSANAENENKKWVWEVQNEWNADRENEYSKFIESVGNRRAGKVGECLTSKDQKPLLKGATPGLEEAFSADCADFPYVLRAYFAFVKKLPFSYTPEVNATGAGGYVTKSPDGNLPGDSHTISAVEMADVRKFMRDLRDQVSSAQFRITPEADVKGRVVPDFYSPAITRQSIRAGTMVYDPSGHVLIVYKVEKDGVVRVMDAHPGSSVTYKSFGPEVLALSRPAHGAGFKNWRPYRNGKPLHNAEISDYSLVQYTGTEKGVMSKLGAKGGYDWSNWKKAEFTLNNVPKSFFEYVRELLADGPVRYNPEEEFRTKLDELVGVIHDRENSVNKAIALATAGVAHPTRLPPDIYHAENEWELFSSPSCDARLKKGFRETRRTVLNLLSMVEKKDPQLQFEGTRDDLKKKLKSIYEEYARQPVVEYVSSEHLASSKEKLKLSFADVEARLFKLSFDPYHCIDLRWGGDEDCHEGLKKEWYLAEQPLRNQIGHDSEIRTDLSLEELKARGPSLWKTTPERIQLKDLFN